MISKIFTKYQVSNFASTPNVICFLKLFVEWTTDSNHHDTHYFEYNFDEKNKFPVELYLSGDSADTFPLGMEIIFILS